MNNRFFAIDRARPGKDFHAEAECLRLPDGRIQIISVRTWKHELELTANKPESSAQAKDWSKVPGWRDRLDEGQP